MPDSSDTTLDRMRQSATDCGWTLEELAERFCASARRELEALDRALDAGDMREGARLAHGLAGASEMAGAHDMGALLRRVEQAARNDLLESAQSFTAQAAGAFQRIARLLGRAAL